MKIISAVRFDRGIGIFDNFINEMFKRKATAKEMGDFVSELLYKLMQNSLYGKSGQREIIHRFKLINNEDVERFELENMSDLSHVFGGKTLVRTQGKISEDLLGVITKVSNDTVDIGQTKEEDNTTEDIFKDRPLPSRKKGSVKSSVSTAAAITAYARIAMSKYKNIEGNKYYGGDTDSVIMEKELDPNLVGKGLGMMKEECRIMLGLFAGKKLYLTVDSLGVTVIKSRGVGRDLESGEDILNFDDFIKLYKGDELKIHKTKFIIQGDGIYIKPQSISVRIPPERIVQINNEVSAILEDKHNTLYELALMIGILCRSLVIYCRKVFALAVVTYGFVLVNNNLIILTHKQTSCELFIRYLTLDGISLNILEFRSKINAGIVTYVLYMN